MKRGKFMLIHLFNLILKLVEFYLDRKQKSSQQKVSPTIVNTGDVNISITLVKD